MTGHHEPDHSETAAERAEREHDARLERRDKYEDRAPVCHAIGCEWPDGEARCSQHADDQPSDTGDAHVEAITGPLVNRLVPPMRRAVLPRDIEDYPEASDRIAAMAEDYASVEVDRLPPMGALHWLVRGHKADGSVDVFRVGSHGSLMPWTEVGS